MNAIVWCVDEDIQYNVMALHSIFSAREHDDQSKFIVLTLSSNKYAKMYSQFNGLEVMYVDDYYNAYFKGCATSINDVIASSFAYCRFLLFALDIFRRYENLLYLDCDTVVKKGLEELFSIQPKNDQIKIMLVPEKLSTDYNLNMLKSFCRMKNIKYNAQNYGNSGVMRVIPKNVSNSDFSNLLCLMKFKFPIHDQGILNFYFQNNIQFIDAKFNAFHETDPYSRVAHSDVAIRQYAGKEKHSMLVDKTKNNMVLYSTLSKLQQQDDRRFYI